MTGKRWAGELAVFAAALAYTFTLLALGYQSGLPQPGNFYPDVQLDMTQVIIRPVLSLFQPAR